MNLTLSAPRSTPPPLALTAGGWRRDARCRKHPTLPATTWDDAPGPGHRELTEVRDARIALAKKVCRTECPVRQQCLRDVDLRYDEGVRGGEDLREIKAEMRRAQKKAG